MAEDRSDRTKPDPGLAADLGACIRDSSHMHTIVGLMQQKGLPMVAVRGQTDHGVPWFSITVQGKECADTLQAIATEIAARLEAERVRLRNEASRG